jgi:putative ABC transport system permease protein
MAFYLAVKEIWRYRGRYVLFSLVIALITTLVLFIAALAGGLANANKQFIEKLDADLLVYQENTDLQATSSRLDESKLREIRRITGIADAGPLAFSTGTVVFPDLREPIDISLIGVEAGRPGEPVLLNGEGLQDKRKDEVIINRSTAEAAGLGVGDVLTLKTIQGTEEEFYELKIVGVTDNRQYFFQPSLIVTTKTWDEIRPKAAVERGSTSLVYNAIALKLFNPLEKELAAVRLPQIVEGIEVADKPTAIQAIPGYAAQQSTLNTQQGFTLLIGLLVVGGFFQIQTLQKVAQIGMLKAIGNNNRTIAISALLQIFFVTIIGVTIGSLGTFLLAVGLPGNVPILFTGASVAIAIGALLLIGPLGGLVSIRLALKIDPLTAIGLNS